MPVGQVLIPKLRGSDQNPMVIASVLRAIGDLAQVGGTTMKGQSVRLYMSYFTFYGLSFSRMGNSLLNEL